MASSSVMFLKSGTATFSVPLETTSCTVSPAFTVVPAAGLVESTVPLGAALNSYWISSERFRWASARMLLAASRDLSTRLGISNFVVPSPSPSPSTGLFWSTGGSVPSGVPSEPSGAASPVSSPSVAPSPAPSDSALSSGAGASSGAASLPSAS